MRPNHPQSDRPNQSLNRRGFLKSAAVGGAVAFAAPAILRAQNLNGKLNIAVVGAGGRGGSNLRSVSGENIVALCDVNATNLNRAAAKHRKARTFSDFRKLYDHAKNFDAVVVSTCEHTHAFATLPALQLGKHVYCEKPLTYNIWEARVIREAAAKAKVATQMGIQIHAREQLPPGGGTRAVRGHRCGERSACLGWPRVGPAAEFPAEWRHCTPAGTTEKIAADSRRIELGLVVGTGTETTFSQRLFPGTKMVSLVGFRQRHNVGPRQSLD